MHQSFDKDLTLDELAAYFWATYPDAKREPYENLFKQAQEAAIDPEVGAGILKQIKSRLGALKLSELAYAHSQGRSSIEKVLEAVEQLHAPVESVEGPEGLNLDLDSLLDGAVRTPGLRWRLDFLNKSLGSLRSGDFGFLMKRPETGGTAFLASEVSYMLDQTESPIIWFD
jgi:hypothetical protein